MAVFIPGQHDGRCHEQARQEGRDGQQIIH
jgi:hypothetical protein